MRCKAAFAAGCAVRRMPTPSPLPRPAPRARGGGASAGTLSCCEGRTRRPWSSSLASWRAAIAASSRSNSLFTTARSACIVFVAQTRSDGLSSLYRRRRRRRDDLLCLGSKNKRGRQGFENREFLNERRCRRRCCGRSHQVCPRLLTALSLRFRTHGQSCIEARRFWAPCLAHVAARSLWVRGRLALGVPLRVRGARQSEGAAPGPERTHPGPRFVSEGNRPPGAFLDRATGRPLRAAKRGAQVGALGGENVCGASTCARRGGRFRA